MCRVFMQNGNSPLNCPDISATSILRFDRLHFLHIYVLSNTLWRWLPLALDDRGLNKRRKNELGDGSYKKKKSHAISCGVRIIIAQSRNRTPDNLNQAKNVVAKNHSFSAFLSATKSRIFCPERQRLQRLNPLFKICPETTKSPNFVRKMATAQNAQQRPLRAVI